MSFNDILENSKNIKALLIGDLMLDEYIDGHVNRVSPEAPVPILLEKKKNQMIGGAGNVFRNLHSLGVKTSLISLLGKDQTGLILSKLIKKVSNKDVFIYFDKNRITSVKTRFLSNNQQLIRVDKEDDSSISKDASDYILKAFKKEIDKNDIVILSDYNKGVINKKIAQQVIKLCNKKKIPIIIDPKNKDFNIYQGADLITPNKKEASEITGVQLYSDKDIELSAKNIIDQYNIKSVLITRGEKGLSYINKKEAIHLSTQTKEVYDVSGAGDTVLAMMAISYVLNINIRKSLYLANIAAGIVVGKSGTAIVKPEEIKYKLGENLSKINNKILKNKEGIVKVVKNWKAKGLKIGFTNGCFDLLHPGHISLLAKSKNLCDKLIIAINSDISIKKLKGNSRPIQSEKARMKILSSLEYCDKICIFDDLTPLSLIKLIKPDIITKGSDYIKNQVVGAQEIEKLGGKVIIIQLIKGQSTTKIIEKSKP